MANLELSDNRIIQEIHSVSKLDEHWNELPKDSRRKVLVEIKEWAVDGKRFDVQWAQRILEDAVSL